jgi:uncharacterized protein involved in response to NO
MWAALWSIGFRPFFLSAALYSVVVIGVWTGIYVGGWNIHPGNMPSITWHAHEMVFGYSMAVVSGFLLTAVRNRTGYPTLSGYPLLALWGTWLLARICFFIEGTPIWLTAIIDNGFVIGVSLAILFPMLKAKSWRNMGFFAKLSLIAISNIIFYLGILNILPYSSIRIGLYSAFYLIVAMVVLTGRTVFPFFLERGIGAAPLKTRPWLDQASLWGFFLFWLAELILPNHLFVGVLSVFLVFVYSVRVMDWYTPKIWGQPLLWVLYLAYTCIALGFVLKAASVFWGVSPYLSIHAFAYGAIGLSTLGMMSRVSLGHTGRNVYQAPKALRGLFLVLAVGAVIRTIFPLLFEPYYMLWVAVSQVLWLLAFSGFLLMFTPILCAPRVDGRPDQ